MKFQYSQKSISLHRSAGVTLIELLVTISIVAILAGLSIPGMATMLANSDINNAQENIAQVLRRARSLAMAQGTITTVNVNAASNAISLTIADGSTPVKTINIPSNISMSENVSIEFNPFGTASVSAASQTLTLAATGYSSIGPRTITITNSGQTNVSR